MAKQIKIPYFAKGLKFLTPLLFGAGIYLLASTYIVFGSILILVGIIILTTNYVTEIDLTRKFYKDYISFLSFPMNVEAGHFTGISKIIIVAGDYSQRIETRVQSRQLDFTDYTGILLFDNGTSLNLLTKTEKEDLLIGLKEFSEYLKVGVEDHTMREPYWVDMSKV